MFSNQARACSEGLLSIPGGLSAAANNPLSELASALKGAHGENKISGIKGEFLLAQVEYHPCTLPVAVGPFS